MREEHKSRVLLGSALPPSILERYLILVEQRKKAVDDDNEKDVSVIADLHINCIVLICEIGGIDELDSDVELLSILSNCFELCDAVSKRYILFYYLTETTPHI